MLDKSGAASRRRARGSQPRAATTSGAPPGEHRHIAATPLDCLPETNRLGKAARPRRPAEAAPCSEPCDDRYLSRSRRSPARGSRQGDLESPQRADHRRRGRDRRRHRRRRRLAQLQREPGAVADPGAGRRAAAGCRHPGQCRLDLRQCRRRQQRRPRRPGPPAGGPRQSRRRQARRGRQDLSADCRRQRRQFGGARPRPPLFGHDPARRRRPHGAERRAGAAGRRRRPWRAEARELQGLLALRQKDAAKAREIFEALSKDPASSPGVRSRAEQLLSISSN